MYLRKDWIYLDFRKYLYIDISNPKKTLNKLKGVFKPLKCYFKFEKGSYSPHPVLWVSKPGFIHIVSHDVEWKDKYDTPRFENWYWSLPLHHENEDDQYWEQALWYLYYSKTISQGLNDEPDIQRAKKSWPWQDMKGNSTWADKFLVK